MTKLRQADALAALYEVLKAGGGRTAVRDLSPDDRRAYYREAKRRSRSTSTRFGDLAPTTQNVRQALADAALAILAVDALGADQVRSALGTVFGSRPGVPHAVTLKARSGKLRPRLLGRDRAA